MFYAGIGKLLAAAAAQLAAVEAAGDAKARRAQRGMTVLLRRLGAVWPQLFGALREETVVLEATLERARSAAAAHGIALPRAAADADPLAHYAALERELEAWIERFHAQLGADWAEPALRDIRRGMAQAAEIQGRVVEAMLAA